MVTTQTTNLKHIMQSGRGNEANGNDQRVIYQTEGRRILDLAFLREEVHNGYLMCETLLELCNIVTERFHGIDAKLFLKFSECSFVNSVVTGKQH